MEVQQVSYLEHVLTGMYTAWVLSPRQMVCWFGQGKTRKAAEQRLMAILVDMAPLLEVSVWPMS